MTGPDTRAADPAAACSVGRHVPSGAIVVDEHGTRHAKCRHCGCSLSRLQSIRRWYRSGQLG
jgi:hypothetical protein